MKINLLSKYFIILFITMFLLTGCKVLQIYTVNFETNGGSRITSFYAGAGNSISEPETPKKDGYTFGGWYSDETLTTAFTFETMPAEDITLYAKWIINKYRITYYDKIDTQIVSYFLEPYFTVVLTNDGRIFTWGDNSYGQLGNGSDTSNKNITDITTQFNLYTEESITSIKTGWWYTVALTSQSRIFTWGKNKYGQLGDGTTENKNKPTDITSKFDLNPGESITSIKAKFYHTVVLTSEGRIFTWGSNSGGQLGTTINNTTPIEITPLFGLNTGESITSIEAGGSHTIALTSQGRIFTWGSNSYGQLGDGTTISKNTLIEITPLFDLDTGEIITSIEAGGSHSIALTSQGHIFIWGRIGDRTYENKLIPTDITTQFNLNKGESITSVKAGYFHTVAITSEGRIYTWGENSYGLLGDGTYNDKLTPTEITPLFNLNTGQCITSIRAGFSQTAAITNDGHIFNLGAFRGLKEIIPVNNNTPKTPIDITTQLSRIIKKIDVESYEYGNSLDNMFTPIKEGYTFGGWYIDETYTTEFTFETMPAEHITLYAKWIKD